MDIDKPDFVFPKVAFFRLKRNRKPIGEIVEWFLLHNRHLKFSDVMDMALLTLFQGNRRIKKMMESAFVENNPDMDCIKEYRIKMRKKAEKKVEEI